LPLGTIPPRASDDVPELLSLTVLVALVAVTITDPKLRLLVESVTAGVPDVFVSEKLAWVVTPATAAVAVYGPPAVPFAVNVADATPNALVARVMVAMKLLKNPLAPAAGAVNVTFTFGTGLFSASVTVTDSALNAVLIGAL
jgi:hypothetical protein